ncbi:TonB-dependent receptor [Pelomonas cellulosilytica]|uniref:TonB-dependent receptor n=1 Tax=Pelomonas cellulosilytica TaxID=2906762 RepID=A0ABS8XR92_9BURK|nr:TonB-dependent receptor [Pelomonas sp. P8]MCE4553683.1 TonB-dependent receptor [Pelomonas sp. P8]
MFKRNAISLAVMAGLASAVIPSFAQQQLERIEITGSAIKRLDAETAVPVTVVKMEDMKKSGITSVEQIMSNLSAVQASNNTAQSIGSSSGGASFADLRGIGFDKTLVLLNGQRIANNAVDGSAPDLNMIPFAAIDRVEVLRDSASSLYGTDAIGGVINFITKNNYTGATATVGVDSPEHAGGKSRSANVGFGWGDLASQGFNVFGVASYRKQDSISGTQRNFNQRVVGGLSYSTDPANYTQDFATYYNPTLPACSGTQVVNVNGECRIVTPAFVDFSPKTETASGMIKGTLAVNENLTLGAEFFIARNRVTTMIAPVPYGGYLLNPGTAYFPNNPNLNPTFNPADSDPTDKTVGNPAFAPTAAFPNPVNVQPGFAYVMWRDFPNGLRGQMNRNDQNRLLLTADGSAAGWDYAVALGHNRNNVGQFLTSGYGDGDMIGEGLLEGVINPFGAQSDAGNKLLADAAIVGRLQHATGTITDLNAHASREVGDWFGAGRQTQLALGVEYRHEKFISAADKDLAAKVVVSTGVDPNSLAEGSRNVSAFYAELAMPVLKGLDVTASLRYDKYSDFGSSTNPKVSFRYQPVKEWLFRGSASTGFRAPTLYELYGTPAYTNTAGDYANPVLCPDGKTGSQCSAQFQVLNSGNAALMPEKSRSASLGVAFQPTAALSMSADLWWINLRQTIGSIPQFALFTHYADYPALQQYFHFASNNTLSVVSNCPGSGCGYVDQTLLNLGKTRTSGVDLNAEYRVRSAYGAFNLALNSTYVGKYEFQDFKDGYWVNAAGTYGESGPVFRWQHNLTGTWSNANWGAGVSVHHKSGYYDFDPTDNLRVASYTTTDVYGSWSPVKAMSLVLGVRNLFDRDPPYTNQSDLFQAGGWDSRYADATGRTYYLRATYNY